MPRLHYGIMVTLAERIAEGSFRPGTMLPKEELLADEFSVTRHVVREAIRGLEERAVVRVKHGRGATVRPARDWNVLDPLVFSAVRGTRGGRKLLAESIEARSIIVGHAAALAAERKRTGSLRALRAALEELEAAEGERFFEAELEFHRVLGEAAGNRPLARNMAAIVEAMAPSGPPSAGRGGSADGYRQVVETVAAGDPAGAIEAVRAQLGARRSARA